MDSDGLRRRHIDSGISVDGEEKGIVEDGTGTSDDTVFTGTTNANKDVETVEKTNKTPTTVAIKERLLSTVNQLRFGGKSFGVAFLLWLIGYFGFSFLWLAIGVTLYTVRRYKQEQKKAVSAVLNNIAQDETKYFQTLKDIYKLSGKDLPSWVYFPDVEKAEWLNIIIEQLWPSVCEFVQNIIIDKVEPSIRTSNRLLDGFSFSKVEIGEKPPRVAGVKVFSNKHTRRSEIVMDLQLIYMSDSNIRVTVNKLSAGVKNLSIRGLLRVELRPLIKEIPLFGAVSVSFVHQPSIDFDLTDLGNFFDIPMIDSILRNAILDTVSSLMVLPERYVLKLADDVDISRLMYPLPKGVVRIHILEAKDLEEKDKKILGIGGGSDPFVIVKVGRNREFKTKIIQHNVNPVWNERFDCPVMEFHTSTIEITLYDDDGALQKADYLGSASIQMASVYNEGVTDEWIPLSNVSKGRIHVRIEWLELSDDKTMVTEAMEHAGKYDLYSAFLNIYVDSAKDLPFSTSSESGVAVFQSAQGAGEGEYEPSAMVKITVPGQDKSLKTKVFENSINPVWEENFQALIQNPRMENIHLKIVDDDNREAGLGNLKIRINDLLTAPKMTKEEPFSLVGSGPNSKVQLRVSVRLLLPKKSNADLGVHKKSAFAIAKPKPLDENNTPRNSTKTSDELSPPNVEIELADTEDLPESEPNENSVPVDETSQPSASDDTKSPAENSSSNFEMSFVDKTLAFFVANSPSFRKKSRKSSHSGSTASEISAFDESRDPRNRTTTNNNNVNLPVLGRLNMKLSYSEKKEKLYVEIIKAENLIVCDEENNTSDPYVRMYLLPHRRGSHKRKTKVVKNNLNPNFNEKFDYDMMKGEVREHQLDVAVKNKTGLLSSEKALMGLVMIDLKTYDFSQNEAEWFSLQKPPKDEE